MGKKFVRNMDGKTKSAEGFRKCPFCGGKPVIYKMENGKYGTSAFVACQRCKAKSEPAWIGVKGENGMIKDLQDLWNKTIYDSKIRGLEKSVKRLHDTIDEYKTSEAECMKKSYRRFKGEDWQ